jgi:uncharacterized protein YoxC
MNVLIFFKIDPWNRQQNMNYITSRGEKILEKEKQIEDEVKRKKKRKV